ncbi:MAG TPA: CARDB domain-containing protein, partial [Candidatus Paceibacterota bacterium]
TNKGTIAANGTSFSVDLGATSRSSAQLVTSGSGCGLYINLQPGASCLISYNVVYSSTSSVSSNTVTIRADSNNTVVESDETNNTKTLTFPITLGGASSMGDNRNLANTLSAMQRQLDGIMRQLQSVLGR